MPDKIYTTNDERNFILQLGTGELREKECYIGLKRMDFLLGYKRSLKRRQNWDGLDKEKICKFLEGEIGRCGNGLIL